MTLQDPLNSEDHARAILNILEDFSGEKARLEEAQRATLNVLEDFSGEKGWLEETQRAVFNILEDFTGEKECLEGTQRAMLNLLEDFNVERLRTEVANKDLSANEERLRQALGEKENLIKEIHHRVKNNLQIIYSMLNLQMSYLKNERAAELFRESRDRVYSMALIHEKLYQSESLSVTDLPEYLKGLIGNLFLSYGVSERAIEPKIEVEDVAFDIDTLIPCALIVTELVSNSLKHAFPNKDAKGEIRVELESLQSGSGDDFKLLVSDNGVGMPAGLDLPNSRTLGLKLVNVLVRQLGGTIRMAQGSDGRGVEFTILLNVSRNRGRRDGR